MNMFAVIHHSAHGHTRHIATHVAESARDAARGERSGLMAQAADAAPSDRLVSSDIQASVMFGRHVPDTLHRYKDSARMGVAA